MTGSDVQDVRGAAIAASFSTVHVVTVTHNSVSTIEQYLDALESSTAYISGVTVVDNASTDDTVALLRSRAGGCSFSLEIIENENSGFAGGYAAAARSSLDHAAPVLCLNPDVILAPGAIDALLDVLNSFREVGIVTMPLVESDGTPDSASRRRLPTLGASMLYSVLGRLTPSRLRYNSRQADPAPRLRTAAGRAASELEATTGALMLVHPRFRTIDEGIFDRDYWMYGEDLQLCADARSTGRTVLMAEVTPSVHVKGVSSGRPRSRRSNRAFHDAMLTYARKNLLTHRVPLSALALAIEAHFHLKELTAAPSRIRRARALR
jgi:N-acetylglucosaminyl-diphospho-decaprenol L-rhamnosyltransferase